MKHLLFTIKKVFVPNRAECFNKRVASINSPTIRFLFCLCLDPGWIHSVSIAILGFYNKREHRTKVIISERVSLSTCPPSSPPKWENEKCKATIIINWVTPLHSSPEPGGRTSFIYCRRTRIVIAFYHCTGIYNIFSARGPASSSSGSTSNQPPSSHHHCISSRALLGLFVVTGDVDGLVSSGKQTELSSNSICCALPRRRPRRRRTM